MVKHGSCWRTRGAAKKMVGSYAHPPGASRLEVRKKNPKKRTPQGRGREALGAGR
jgi:hypothetical protein